jgi:transposase
MAVGRPSKLTPETRQRLVDAVRAGNYIDAACSHAGIAVSTYYLWREKAKGSRTGEYKELMDEIEAAEAAAEVRMVAQWQQQIPNDWRAAREFLARRFPNKWSPLEKQEISGPEGAPVKVYKINLGGELDDDD